MFAVIFGILILFWFGRSFIDSVLRRVDQNTTYHPGQSAVVIASRSDPRSKVVLLTRDKEGKARRVIVDKQQFDLFQRGNTDILLKDLASFEERVGPGVKNILAPVFERMEARIERFADWYFAWTTTYKLLGVAIRSAVVHLPQVEAMGIQEAVGYDVDAYIRKHYEEIVLRPEISNPDLQHAVLDFILQEHAIFRATVGQINDRFYLFLAKNTELLREYVQDEVVLQFDWDAIKKRIDFAGFEKGGGGAVLGSVLMANGESVGAKLGAVMLGTAGKAAAGKALLSAGGKGVISKLAAPIVAKGVSTAAAAASGAGVGAALGSPAPGVGNAIGATVGATVGVLTDLATNEGVELMQRHDFIADVKDVQRVTHHEFSSTLTEAILKSGRSWYLGTVDQLVEYNGP
ncbi:MAG: hypothetical protein HQL85_12965 [Magnetococcales bacterium]|nr:hypothetical protein [Magnetococcales bacterium]